MKKSADKRCISPGSSLCVCAVWLAVGCVLPSVTDEPVLQGSDDQSNADNVSSAAQAEPIGDGVAVMQSDRPASASETASGSTGVMAPSTNVEQAAAGSGASPQSPSAGNAKSSQPGAAAAGSSAPGQKNGASPQAGNAGSMAADNRPAFCSAGTACDGPYNLYRSRLRRPHTQLRSSQSCEPGSRGWDLLDQSSRHADPRVLRHAGSR